MGNEKKNGNVLTIQPEAETLLYIDQSDDPLLREFGRVIAIDQEHSLLPVGVEKVSAKYPWRDDSVRAIDYEYVATLHRTLVADLSASLETVHGPLIAGESWDKILSPWLYSALSILRDRWRIVGSVLAEAQGQVVLQKSLGRLSPASGTVSFIARASKDGNWNRWVIEQVAAHFFDGYITFKSHLAVEQEPPPRLAFLDMSRSLITNGYRALRRGVERSTLRLVYFFLKAWSPVDSPLMIWTTTYFSLVDRIRLAWRLRREVRIREFRRSKETTSLENADMRLQLGEKLKSLENDDPFEAFCRRLLPKLIPLSMLEGLEKELMKSTDLNKRPSIIFTANSHFYDEQFKAWAASMCSDGATLITSGHGGGFKYRDNRLGFEQRISDLHACPWPASAPNEVALPSPKIVSQRKIKRTKVTPYLVILAFNGKRWATTADSAPYSYRGLTTLQMAEDLTTELNAATRGKVLLKLQDKSNVYPWALFRREVEKIEFSHEVKISAAPLKRWLKQARIVVCLYPQTTFTEALSQGIPTVLLFDDSVSGLDTATTSLTCRMAELGLLFRSPSAAAQHVNTFWNEPHAWWDSEPVRELRDEILRYSQLNSGNNLEKWETFFQQQIRAIVASKNNLGPSV